MGYTRWRYPNRNNTKYGFLFTLCQGLFLIIAGCGLEYVIIRDIFAPDIFSLIGGILLSIVALLFMVYPGIGLLYMSRQEKEEYKKKVSNG